jgi:hypothetical protein
MDKLRVRPLQVHWLKTCLGFVFLFLEQHVLVGKVVHFPSCNVCQCDFVSPQWQSMVCDIG